VTASLRDRIAIIGWGSLIWDLDDLASKVSGGWATGAGPVLPIEFSRISPKRLMSLVAVIDPEHGDPCRTHAIASARGAVDDAAADLARRERAPDFRIGLVCARTGRARSSDPRIAGIVADWCAGEGARGAVWTDLPRNFEAETGTQFDVAAGLAYLRGLGPEAAAEARRYIDGAPRETHTPLRRALAAAPWWMAR
jgi:hypothetical protein